MEKARDANIEAAQCKLVADSEAEVREMQRMVDEQIKEQEGDSKIESAMQERLALLREQRKQQLLDRQREMSKFQESMSAAQINNLKAQYERELSDLEAAIRREGAQQLAKMRKALLARRLKKEQKRKEAIKQKQAELEKLKEAKP